MEALSRCAAHPSRVAVDACPHCQRPRCDADRLRHAGRCLLCAAEVVVDPATRRRQDQERLLQGTFAALWTSLLFGVITAQYVQADLFAYLAPLLLGAVTGTAAVAAARNPRPGVQANRLRLVVTLLAVLGTAFGIMLEGTFRVYDPSLDVLVPYVAAGGMAWIWTTPPKKRGRRGQGASTRAK